MAIPVRELRVPDQSLNTVAAGLALADRAIDAVRQGESVRIDLTAAERMTPSFANALVMSILEKVGLDAFRDRVTMDSASELVREAWSKALERYQRGIRLSTQRNGV